MMRETSQNVRCSTAEPVHPPPDEMELFRFIDFSEGKGWAELESALPEGAIDDVTGRKV